MRLGVIGGTGIDALAGLTAVRRREFATPWGEPSAALEDGRIDDVPVVFLQRHGKPRSLPPHLINYRANLWALRECGVTDVLAINAVGGISPGAQTGSLVIPHQLIDYTWGREHTFDLGGDAPIMHIDFTDPYDQELRSALLSAAVTAGVRHADGAVHAVTQGPRLETAAEVQRLARDDCDIVGMTGMPEAALARELGLRYSCICMVVNAAAGLDDKPLTLESMRQVLEQGASAVAGILRSLLLQRYGPEGAEDA